MEIDIRSVLMQAQRTKLLATMDEAEKDLFIGIINEIALEDNKAVYNKTAKDIANRINIPVCQAKDLLNYLVDTADELEPVGAV